MRHYFVKMAGVELPPLQGTKEQCWVAMSLGAKAEDMGAYTWIRMEGGALSDTADLHQRSCLC